jgi:hypothetical protein
LIQALLQSPGNLLPKHLARGVLALLENLPPGDGLCHGDDWTWTRRAGPGLDLGHCHVVLCELVPENHDDPERPRALNAAVQSEYARLAGMSPMELTAVMESYLPIVRAFFLLVWRGTPALRERLIQRVEATLRSGSHP